MPTGAAVEKARHARRPREARRADRRSRRARARPQAADRLPQGDGVQLADAPRGRVFQHRCRRDRAGRASSRRAALLPSPACGGGSDAQSASRMGASRLRRASRPSPSRSAASGGTGDRQHERRAHAAGACRRAARRRAQRKNSTARNTKPCAASIGSKPGSSARATQGFVAIDTETTSLDPMQAALCGFSLAVAPRTRPATCRSATGRAATAAAACSRARSRPIKSPSAQRSTRSSRCSRIRACSRSART